MQGFSDRDLGVLRKRDALAGVRCWYPKDGALVGVYGKKWEPGPHRAACTVHLNDHADTMIPSWSCWCGFWAGYTTGSLRDSSYGEKPVVGVIRGWGRMTGGNQGFRAERAEITGLHLAYEYVKLRENTGTSDYYVPPESAWKLREDEAALAERYPGIPFYPSIDAMLEAHPIRRKK